MTQIADAIKQALLLKSRRIQASALDKLAKKAQVDMQTVVAGMPRNRPSVEIERLSDSKRRVYWKDPVRINFKSGGSATRMELLEKGTEPYSKPRDGRPMRFRVGGSRSTVPKQIKSGNYSPPTEWVSTYSRNGMESGDWIPLVGKRVAQAAPECISDAVREIA